MKVIIDNAEDAFDDAVAVLYRLYGYETEWEDDEKADEEEDGAEPRVGANDNKVLPGGWTYKRLKKWTEYLQPGAAEIVSFVAANAPEVSIDEVAKHYGKYLKLPGPADGKILGGAMSSGGHALKQVGAAVKAQPIDRDWTRRKYIVDERIAEILVELLGEPEA